MLFSLGIKDHLLLSNIYMISFLLLRIRMLQHLNYKTLWIALLSTIAEA